MLVLLYWGLHSSQGFFLTFQKIRRRNLCLDSKVKEKNFKNLCLATSFCFLNHSCKIRSCKNYDLMLYHFNFLLLQKILQVYYQDRNHLALFNKQDYIFSTFLYVLAAKNAVLKYHYFHIFLQKRQLNQ